MGDYFCGQLEFPAEALRIPAVKGVFDRYVASHSSEVIKKDGLILLVDGQAYFGRFQDLEEKLIEYKVPFDTTADAFEDYPEVHRSVRFIKGRQVGGFYEGGSPSIALSSFSGLPKVDEAMVEELLNGFLDRGTLELLLGSGILGYYRRTKRIIEKARDNAGLNLPSLRSLVARTGKKKA